MNPTSRLREVLFAATAIFFTTTAYAYDSNETTYNTLQQQNDASYSYVTGGIGEDELDAMEAEKSSYNVHLMNTDKSGAYLANTAVAIVDRKGADVIAVQSGPLLYLNLPAGRYKLTAENAGVEQIKNFRVSKNKPTDLHLMWNVAE